MNKQRNQTLDIAKALAIVSVIMGHAIQFGSGEAYLDGELYLNNPVFKFIYSFHMPLFMLISGYLFAFSIEKDTKKNIFKQRIKSLVIPIFIWALIPTTQKLCKMNDVSLIDLPIKYVGTILFYLWFLWSLFYNSVILIALNGGGKNKQIISYGVIFVIMFFIPDSFNLALYKFMLPYFLLGFYFNKLHLVSIITLKPIVILGICAISYIYMMQYYNYEAYIYTSGYSVIQNGFMDLSQIRIDLYRFIVGLLGSLSIILTIDVCISIIPSFIKTIILFIGKHTLGIYIVSDLCTSMLLYGSTTIITKHHFGVNTIEMVIILLFSTMMTVLINKNKFTRKLLLGAKA